MKSRLHSQRPRAVSVRQLGARSSVVAVQPGANEVEARVRTCSPHQSSRFLIACAALSVLAAGVARAAEAEIKTPDCAELEAWAAGVDNKDRWLPIEGSRAWIPKAFQDPAFEELFGLPALQWQADDAKAMGAHLYKCGQKAEKERRTDARNALYEARGDMIGKLNGVLLARDRAAAAEARAAKEDAARAERDVARQAQERARVAARERQQEEAEAAQAAQARARQKQRATAMDEALTALLETPDSPKLLRQLTLLRQADLKNTAQYNQAYVQGDNEVRQFLYVHRQQGGGPLSAETAAKLDERIAALHGAMLASYRERIAKMDNNADGLHFLDRLEQEVDREIASVLGVESANELRAGIADRRSDIRADIHAAAKAQIEKLAANQDDPRRALERIEGLVAEVGGWGLTPEQLTDVRGYADAREQDLANSAIKAAAAKLDDYPETLKGLTSLQREIESARGGVLSRAGATARDSYVVAASERLTEIAEAALPEFEAGLASVPESAMGLNMINATLVTEKGFRNVKANVREDYETAVAERRAAIEGVLQAKAAEQRAASVAAGGDPDLVGFRFVDPRNGAEFAFPDERRVILSLNGKQDVAGYEAENDRVVIYGPGIPLTFQRSGTGAQTQLSGLGLVLHRVSK